MAYSFPIEIYTQIEASVGKETALLLAVSVEQGIVEIQREANALAQQKKLEVRDDLLKELASKADVALARAELEGKINTLEQKLLGELKAVEARLDRKFTILMVIMIVSVYITNQSTIAFILKVFGVLK